MFVQHRFPSCFHNHSDDPIHCCTFVDRITFLAWKRHKRPFDYCSMPVLTMGLVVTSAYTDDNRLPTSSTHPTQSMPE